MLSSCLGGTITGVPHPPFIELNMIDDFNREELVINVALS